MKTVTARQAKELNRKAAGNTNGSYHSFSKFLGFRSATLPGGVGNGSKIHKLLCDIVEIDGEDHIYKARCLCGSAKFTAGGGSFIDAGYAEDSTITCTKCSPPERRSVVLEREIVELRKQLKEKEGEYREVTFIRDGRPVLVGK